MFESRRRFEAGVHEVSDDGEFLNTPVTIAARGAHLIDLVMQVGDSSIAQTWATAVSDLAALPLGIPEGPAAPVAGLPLYQSLFGRDVLTTGWQALLATPDIHRDALEANAAHIGSRIDDWRDKEPGKMLQGRVRSARTSL